MARGSADVGLGHARLEKRKPHAAAHRRSMARPVIARVFGGRAIREMLQPQIDTDRLERLEQLLLAVEAAVRIVARVSLKLELVRVDLDQPSA